MKKKTIAIFVSCAFFMIAVFSLASAATNGQPFNALQDSLNKLQAQVDKLSQNSDTGGVHRKVYTGTFPSSIPSTLGDDDIMVEKEMNMDQVSYTYKEYYKKVSISEIDTNDMPQVSLYVKDYDLDSTALGDVWQPVEGFVTLKDGAAYLRYADDSSNAPYGGINLYAGLAGKEYKIVVVY